MRTNRTQSRKKSNNPQNTNKNVCGLQVAKYLGVGEKTRYLHNMNDLVYATRKAYTVRSRGSQVNGKSVGKMRSKLAQIALEVKGVKGFIVRVAGHVLFISPEGKTIVDTDPRKRDARKITHCYIVY